MSRPEFRGDRLERAKALFESALELDADGRAVLLERESGDDPELREYVIQLLRSHESGGDSFLTPPRSEEDGATIQASYSGPKPGAQIGHYEIREKLGQGGMGSVYEAWDSLLQRPVAIKFVADQFAHSTQARKRFLREARSASKLTHSGIATVYNAGEHEGQAYIVFRLIDGETVFERAQRERFELSEALRLIREAAEALGHAHDGGVLHRDVTSRNLMIDRDGSAVIVDFGLALPEMDSRITQTGTTFGTIAYMAPEVVQGEEHDRRSDLYGLGVVLYEMLTGELPFQTERTLSLLFAIVNEPLQPARSKRPELPQDVDRVLSKLLAREPSYRYQNSGELVEDLRLLEQSQRPKARLSTLGRWPWRAAVMASVLIGGVLYFQRDAPDTPVAADREIEPIRVAVLPLQNTSVDPDASTLMAEGLSEALAGKLGRIASLRVTPWITSQNYTPGPRLPLQEIASELAVDQVVVGSFNLQGERLQVRLTYVDGTSGMTDWTEEYIGVEDELLELPQRIARGYLERIGATLNVEETDALLRKPTENLEAYRLYLQGVAALRDGTRTANLEGRRFFEAALDLDQDFAEAHLGIGAALTTEIYNGWESTADNLGLATRSYRRALDIDPELWGAHRGLIRVAWYRGDSDEVLRIGARAKNSDPIDISAILCRAESLYMGGFPELAVPSLEQVLQLDPANQAASLFLIYSLVGIGTQEAQRAALQTAEAQLRRFGEDPDVYFWMGMAYDALREYEPGRLAYARALELQQQDSPPNLVFHAGVLEYDSGNSSAAHTLWLRYLDGLRSKVSVRRVSFRLTDMVASIELLLGNQARFEALSSVTTDLGTSTKIVLAIAYACRGDQPMALETLHRMVDAGSVSSLAFLLDKQSLDSLRENPEFVRYIERDEELRNRLLGRHFPELASELH